MSESSHFPLQVEAQVACLADLLLARGWSIATAESCTGGLIAAACTDRSGSSQWFERGFVSYSNEAKSELLGVPEELISVHGAVSEPVARAMAEGAALRAGTQVAIAVTGVAGPTGGSAEKPVGTVWFGLCSGGHLRTERRCFDGDRRAVREATVRHALDMVLHELRAPGTVDAPPAPDWFEGFEEGDWKLHGMRLHGRVRHNPGRPALLLVHGFPQSHVMWHRVARYLAPHFSLVLPDLRGYGDSACPPGLPDHANYSKRAMAADLVALMDHLGFERFHLCGHDRGGRVAHRLALDHSARVQSLCVIDIAPTLDMYAATNMDFARGYYHWFHLIQPSPLPERMIGGDARAYLHAKLGGWGSGGLRHYEARALAEYERCFTRPANIHGACEDYRAAAGIDLDHDRHSRTHGERIACPTLVLWGQRGLVARMFDPIGLWQAQCSAGVTGTSMPAGHFIPEELPEDTAQALLRFIPH